MSRRSKKSLSVALFPFLAVLVCTMGSLIFLLLVTTRQIRDRAVAQAEAEAEAAKPALPLLSVSHSAPTVIAALPEMEPQDDPREVARTQHAAALAERERELNELLAEWRQKASQLATQRKDKAKTLAQRRSVQEAAARRIAEMQKELRELETQFGSLTGELSVSSMGDATRKERQLIEQQIAALQKRLKAAQVAEAGGESKFMVVPFDPQSGTSRRPILIECTADGLRFLPEDIVIRPDDLEGFTPRINPVLAGSNALVSYWTAWNLKQSKPAREPEPYVLMLVRPSGTVAYYIAMRMLTTLKQPHGYELIEEDTRLQQPELDPGAKAACEAAVKRLLAERDQIKKFSSGGGGIAGFARGGGAKGDAFRTGGGSRSAGRGSANRFDVTDVTGGDDEVGSRSWERIENFAGRNPRPSGKGDPQSVANGTSGPARTQRTTKGEDDEFDTDAATSGANVRRSRPNGTEVGQRDAVVPQGDQGSAVEATGTGGGTPQRGPSGIERLTDEDDTGSAPGSAGGQAGGAAPLDIGLGSTGPTAVPVHDRRSKKGASNKPLEPEQFTRKRWGLSAADAAIGLEREVSIDVESNRLVIAGKHAIRIGEGESKQEVFERLVTVLDLQARDWGRPPQGFYWTPSLRFVVADAGSSNYELAKTLAERAGLATSKEFATDRSAKPTYTPASGATGERLRSPVLPKETGGSPLPPVAPRRVPGTPVLPSSRVIRGETP